MNIEFGPFLIDKDGILIDGYYRIDASRLWETQDFEGTLLWDWLIHLTEKAWVTYENYNQLNTAFFFAQDIFKNEKPIHAREGSVYQTLYVQKQMMENRKKFEDQNTNKSKGFQQLDFKKMAEYREREQEVKLL